LGIGDWGLGIGDWGLGIRDSGFGIRDSGFGIGDSGFGIRRSRGRGDSKGNNRGLKHPSPALPFTFGEREGEIQRQRQERGSKRRCSTLPPPFGAAKGRVGEGCFGFGFGFGFGLEPAPTYPPFPTPDFRRFLNCNTSAINNTAKAIANHCTAYPRCREGGKVFGSRSRSRA